MAKTTQTPGMVVLHVVKEAADRASRPFTIEGHPGDVILKAVRIADIAKAEPAKPLWGNNANSFVAFGDRGEFVTETVEEVAMLVNARANASVDMLARIADVLENWASTNFGRGI